MILQVRGAPTARPVGKRALDREASPNGAPRLRW
jgi:hypothetical protein